MILRPRTLPALLAGILVCSLLVGCSKPPPPEEKPIEKSTAPESIEKSPMPGGGPPSK
jgi:hypothetical protein